MTPYLVYSTITQKHAHQLKEVFRHLRETGLTLQGRKSQLGMSKVHGILGAHVSQTGMALDHHQVFASVD